MYVSVHQRLALYVCGFIVNEFSSANNYLLYSSEHLRHLLESIPKAYVPLNDFPTDLKDKKIPKSVRKSVGKSPTVISVIGQKCTF